MTARMIELAGVINTEMPDFVADKALAAADGEPCRSALILGVAYKRDVDDPRESPAFEILSRFRERGVQVDYHDPHIAKLPTMRSWPDLPELDSVELDEDSLQRYDLVVIVTDHSTIDWELVWSRARRIVDTRGVFRDRNDERLVRA